MPLNVVNISLVVVIDGNFNFPRNTGLIMENEDGKEMIDGTEVRYPVFYAHCYRCAGFDHFVSDYRGSTRRRSPMLAAYTIVRDSHPTPPPPPARLRNGVSSCSTNDS